MDTHLFKNKGDVGGWLEGFAYTENAILEELKRYFQWSDINDNWLAKKPSFLKEVTKHIQ